MNRLTEALIFAANAHDGSVRKGSSIPYILHPAEAAAIVASITSDEDAIIAAILHDTIEDENVSADVIRQRFGDRVCALVMADTESKRDDLSKAESWYDRKRETLERLAACTSDAQKAVVLGDKLANLRAIRNDSLILSDAVWERFNQKDKFMHAWYYRSFIGLTASLSHTAAYKEYVSLCDAVFGAGFDL